MAKYFSVGLILLGLGTVLAAHVPRMRLASHDEGTRSLGIYKGKPTTIEKYPFIASLYKKGDENNHAAGAIVGDSWVLTTVNVIYDAKALDITVYVGSANSKQGAKYKVKKVVKHPKWDDITYSFLLIQVDGTFKYSNKVKKVALPTKALRDGDRVDFAGWGFTNNTQTDLPTQLLEASLPVYNYQFCSHWYHGIKFDNSVACLYENGGPAPCVGDWGDPVVKDGVLYFLFQNMDGGGMCTSEASPSLCSNVLPVVPWIKKITK